MALTFAEEPLLQCLEEAKPLLTMHWREIARNQDLIALDPDFIRYTQLQERGQLLVVTARDAGRLVGYATFFIDAQIHYRKTRWAESDVYWLHPDYRGQGHGERMMAFCEAELRSRSVVVLHAKAKDAHAAAGAMWQKRGFEPIETVFAKVL